MVASTTTTTITTDAADRATEANRSAPAGAKLACSGVLCSHSIGTRLSRKLALFTMAVLSVLFTLTWYGVGMMVKERNASDLHERCMLLADVLALEADAGGEATVLQRLRADAPMRALARLQVWRADGSPLFMDEALGRANASHLRTDNFVVKTPDLPGGQLNASYTVDFSRDAAIGQRWALLLVFATLAAGAVVSVGARWHVRRQLRPLNELATQTRAISPRRLDQRLALTDPAEELLPWIDQFNALMGRLDQAYAQLEGFNADVAHELRTPLATLIGQTELALSRERSVDSLRDTLVSNLEEVQRLSALVNDMLFLSQADRGASARRGKPVSLAALAAEVAEFHEATLEDTGLTLRIEGDATLALDEALVKRALSNLLGNATRFAESGSEVVVHVAPEASVGGLPTTARVSVHNRGDAIAPEHLPRLFDRFFRVDDSRCCDGVQHHGLGLAIVAAIARMHGGQPEAESADGATRVGFTLAA